MRSSCRTRSSRSASATGARRRGSPSRPRGSSGGAPPCGRRRPCRSSTTARLPSCWGGRRATRVERQRLQVRARGGNPSVVALGAEHGQDERPVDVRLPRVLHELPREAEAEAGGRGVGSGESWYSQTVAPGRLASTSSGCFGLACLRSFWCFALRLRMRALAGLVLHGRLLVSPVDRAEVADGRAAGGDGLRGQQLRRCGRSGLAGLQLRRVDDRHGRLVRRWCRSCPSRCSWTRRRWSRPRAARERCCPRRPRGPARQRTRR